jgi:hypothetical protein
MIKKIFPIILFLILIVGCKDKELSRSSTVENNEPKNETLDENSTLPSEATGIFTGEEPPYLMSVGNQKIQMPSSKWRIEISANSFYMQQVSDGQTIHYSGKYNKQSENDFSIIIKGDLVDDKYNQSFTPTLRFNKNSNTWFLEGVAGSEGCSLEKQ